MRANIKCHHHHTGQRRLAYIRGRGPLHLHLRTRVRRARSTSLIPGGAAHPDKKGGQEPSCIEQVKRLNHRSDESETAFGMAVWAGCRKLTGCPGKCSLSLIIPYESTYVSLRQRQPAAAFEPALSLLWLWPCPRVIGRTSSSIIIVVHFIICRADLLIYKHPRPSISFSLSLTYCTSSSLGSLVGDPAANCRHTPTARSLVQPRPDLDLFDLVTPDHS